MASVFTHTFVAAAMGGAWAGGRGPARVWAAAALCAVLPDADVLGFFFGVPYGHTFGHRGFTHSIVFAALTGAAVVALFFREAPDRRALTLLFALATLSHPLLDALTDGGLGVAFFSPFSNERYFFPFRPVRVSPVSVSSFFGEWGLAVIRSELQWVWLPCAAVAAPVLICRRRA